MRKLAILSAVTIFIAIASCLQGPDTTGLKCESDDDCIGQKCLPINGEKRCGGKTFAEIYAAEQIKSEGKKEATEKTELKPSEMKGEPTDASEKTEGPSEPPPEKTAPEEKSSEKTEQPPTEGKTQPEGTREIKPDKNCLPRELNACNKKDDDCDGIVDEWCLTTAAGPSKRTDVSFPNKNVKASILYKPYTLSYWPERNTLYITQPTALSVLEVDLKAIGGREHSFITEDKIVLVVKSITANLNNIKNISMVGYFKPNVNNKATYTYTVSLEFTCEKCGTTKFEIRNINPFLVDIFVSKNKNSKDKDRVFLFTYSPPASNNNNKCRNKVAFADITDDLEKLLSKQTPPIVTPNWKCSDKKESVISPQKFIVGGIKVFPKLQFYQKNQDSTYRDAFVAAILNLPPKSKEYSNVALFYFKNRSELNPVGKYNNLYLFSTKESPKAVYKNIQGIEAIKVKNNNNTTYYLLLSGRSLENLGQGPLYLTSLYAYQLKINFDKWEVEKNTKIKIHRSPFQFYQFRQGYPQGTALSFGRGLELISGANDSPQKIVFSDLINNKLWMLEFYSNNNFTLSPYMGLYGPPEDKPDPVVSARFALFNTPLALTIAKNYVFIGDTLNGKVKYLSPSGDVVTIQNKNSGIYPGQNLQSRIVQDISALAISSDKLLLAISYPSKIILAFYDLKNKGVSVTPLNTPTRKLLLYRNGTKYYLALALGHCIKIKEINTSGTKPSTVGNDIIIGECSRQGNAPSAPSNLGGMSKENVRLYSPLEMAFSNGKLYFMDRNNCIREYSHQTDKVRVLAGQCIAGVPDKDFYFKTVNNSQNDAKYFSIPGSKYKRGAGETLFSTKIQAFFNMTVAFDRYLIIAEPMPGDVAFEIRPFYFRCIDLNDINKGVRPCIVAGSSRFQDGPLTLHNLSPRDYLKGGGISSVVDMKFSEKEGVLYLIDNYRIRKIKLDKKDLQEVFK